MELLQCNEDTATRFRMVGGMVKQSRKEFCEKHGFNRFTIQSWEMGRNSINIGIIYRFCEALSAEGIFCAPEWLIHGRGAGPVKLGAREDFAPEASVLAEREEHNSAQLEVQLFRKHQTLGKRDPIVVEVSDQAMRPYFSKGDLVGGYFLPERSTGTLLGQIAIVGLSPGNHVVRRLMRDGVNYLLIPTDYTQRAVSVKKIESVAKILWHRSF